MRQFGTPIAPVTTRIYDWAKNHPVLAGSLLPLAFVAYTFARDMSSIYFAIPPLPDGTLQIIAVVSDAGRYVATDGHVKKDGKVRTDILIAFDRPFQNEGKSISFEAKREWIDCSKSLIELEGAGFYNERGEQVLTRYFERKPEAPGALDLEVDYLCHNRRIAVPPVTGYRAALQQLRAVRAHAQIAK